MAKERIMISFQRSKISKKTCEYLCSKLDEEEDGDLMNNITLLQTGLKKKLKAEEANKLVLRLLSAILVNDDLEESVTTEPENVLKNTVTDSENDEHESEADESDSENT